MKLAISNIAWLLQEDEQIHGLLREMEVAGIEIAPTKYWHNPTLATNSEIFDAKSRFEAAGFLIPAAQALLFGHPELTLFQDERTRNKTLNYLLDISRLCSSMGISTMVFGSPKNRQRNGMQLDISMKIAKDFFFDLAERISSLNVTFCIEPNPLEYGCDFIVNSSEAMSLVQQVDHPNFRLHLDTSAMFLNKENPAKILPECLPYLQHLHVSEPFLGLIGDGHNCHQCVAQSLHRYGYEGWISIEMRSGLLPSNRDAIRRAVEFTKETYFGN
jgi:sugar phosphate isomerase/epimerase